MKHTCQPTSRLYAGLPLYAGLTMRERAALFLAIAALTGASWRKRHSRMMGRAVYFLALVRVAPLLLCLIGAVAAAPATPRTGKPCSIVYINGDAVISCPKGVR